MSAEEVEIGFRDKQFVFYFTPAEEKDKPILLIFHGHGYGSEFSKFKSPGWNVVCPMDKFGYEGLGSWYLGENGDLFWLEVMPQILEYVRRRSGRSRLYMWGSSMGGYASILYGHLLGARAIYANVPQTLFLARNIQRAGCRSFFPLFFLTLIPNTTI